MPSHFSPTSSSSSSLFFVCFRRGPTHSFVVGEENYIKKQKTKKLNLWDKKEDSDFILRPDTNYDKWLSN